ncbi:reticulocyte-binding protein homolog 2a-like [Hydractinia symbiolongicarpus]|uniref:reticulocyte-binding protein homolog 2a-like n=1 Tax=Hydractinia symbiolongicarpus TaxID=13093 RepID=UPI00254F0D6E|nr:reticulocyte-binding protein homolog 2a-like [Hydractinia symbiolongicarpus]XP_057301224.1 reticulocyte-binding protein homolog 2a-like [Hydractinia symbiolongicarpus]
MGNKLTRKSSKSHVELLKVSKVKESTKNKNKKIDLNTKESETNKDGNRHGDGLVAKDVTIPEAEQRIRVDNNIQIEKDNTKVETSDLNTVETNTYIKTFCDKILRESYEQIKDLGANILKSKTPVADSKSISKQVRFDAKVECIEHDESDFKEELKRNEEERELKREEHLAKDAEIKRENMNTESINTSENNTQIMNKENDMDKVEKSCVVKDKKEGTEEENFVQSQKNIEKNSENNNDLWGGKFYSVDDFSDNLTNIIIRDVLSYFL